MHNFMNEESINNLEIKMVDSVISDKLTELSFDIGESFIDVLMEDGVAQNIPIFGTIYKLGKAGLGIREQYFMKKVYKFLLNIKSIPKKERLEFIKDLENENYGQRAGETLINLLDRFDNNQKPIFLANLIKARVENKIDIVNFLRLASIIEKAFIPDLKSLHEYKDDKLYCGHESESLKSLGLIYQSVIDSNGINNKFSITSLGQDILDYVL